LTLVAVAADVLLGGAALLAGLCALFWVTAGVRLLSFRRHFASLPDVPPVEPAGGWPRVSLIVPARNEERTLLPAVQSLLRLDYPSLQVVAVDDRSEDATGRLLDEAAKADPRLRVVHVASLPEGWLGKNHAMAEGARHAAGSWLLFTDADVHFAPDALKRAMAFALRHGLGHAVAFPHFVAPGFLERAFVSAFGAFVTLKFRVWELHRAGTGAYVGVGAFNLVRREDYERVGGHRPLRMEVLDDVKLGLVLRRSGVPQGACDSGGLVRVRWQHGFRASLAGLVKNTFAGPEWSVGMALVAVAAVGLLSAAPPLCAALHPWAFARLLGVLGTLGPMALHGVVARRAAGGSGLEGLAFPLCGLLLSGVVLYSTLAAVWRGGIFWRGTFYPLAELRRGYVRRRDWPQRGAVGWPSR
jgi:hypothetical protein